MSKFLMMGLHQKELRLVVKFLRIVEVSKSFIIYNKYIYITGIYNTHLFLSYNYLLSY